MTYKENLIQHLYQLGNLETHPFKRKAYFSAISVIRKIDETELLEADGFTSHKGIGKGISDKMVEYRSTGNISKIDKLIADNPFYISQSAAALDPELYKVRKGYISKKITLAAADKIVACWEYDFENYAGQYVVCGSYRRRKSMIADLDIICNTADAFAAFNKYFESCGYLLLVSGSTKFSFKMTNPEATQIDVALALQNFPFQILHFTGSKEHNVMLRQVAKTMGLSLSQYGFKADKTTSADIANKLYGSNFETENDIFQFLNVTFVTPENR